MLNFQVDQSVDEGDLDPRSVAERAAEGASMDLEPSVNLDVFATARACA